MSYIECRKTKNQSNYNGQSEPRKKVTKSQWAFKGSKRGKTRTTKSQFIAALHLIGEENDTSHSRANEIMNIKKIKEIPNRFRSTIILS